MFCSNCGASLSEGAKFCFACGTPTGAQSTPPSQPAAPQATPPQQTAPYAPPAPQEVPPQQPAPYAPPAPQAVPPQQPAPYAPPAYTLLSGTGAPEQPPVPPVAVRKKKSPLKLILLCAGGLVLLAGIVFGIWYLIRTQQPDAQLARAAQKTGEAMEDYLKPLTNLNTCVSNYSAIASSNKSSGSFTYDYSFRLGDYSGDNHLSMDFKSDADNRTRIDYTAQMPSEENSSTVSVDCSLFIDQEQLQFSSSSLLNDRVFGVPCEGLGAQWNASDAAKVFGELPEDFNLQFSSYSDIESLKQSMQEAFGEDWTAFEASVEVRQYDGVSAFDEEGKLLTVTWDNSLLKKMVRAANSRSSTDITSIMNSADYFMKTFGEPISEIADNQLFINDDGCLAGIWIKRTSGEKLRIVLDGRDNLWQHVTIVNNGSVTGTFQLDVSSDTLLLQVEADSSQVLRLEYTDSTGALAISAPQEEAGEPIQVEGSLRPSGSSVQLELDVDTETELMEDFVLSIKYQVRLHIDPLTEEIRSLSTLPEPLLEKSEAELRAILDDMEKNFGFLSEAFESFR